MPHVPFTAIFLLQLQRHTVTFKVLLSPSTTLFTTDHLQMFSAAVNASTLTNALLCAQVCCMLQPCFCEVTPYHSPIAAPLNIQCTIAAGTLSMAAS